jgi:hypothetical protein
MGTRYSRRAADGTFEHHDSKESLVAAAREESNNLRAFWFGLLGLVAGGFVAHQAVTQLNPELPKLLRFGLITFSAIASMLFLARFADLL